MSCDFPFTIMDVASLLGLRIRRSMNDGAYVDCPFCGDKRGKMKITTKINVFRCNYCDEHGGMLALYGKLHKIDNSEALKEINDAMKTDSSANEYTVNEKKKESHLPDIPQSELAPIDVIHNTLKSMLKLLSLSKTHRENLRKRGLSDDEIDRRGYKSTPLPHLCRALTEQLIQKGCRVNGVPGFYVDKYGKWRVKFYKKTSGIIIPIRGIDSKIRGIQIRLDVPIKNKDDPPDKTGTKYIWLSSSNLNMGVTSGSPVHFVGDVFAKTVYVTEGALKGDTAHFLMNRTFLCVAGANNVSQLEPIFAWLSENGTKLIVEAHDMDKYANEMVIKGASKLYRMARLHGLDSKRLTWNPNYKGIDDWQLAMKIKEQRAKEVCRMNFKERFISGLCDMNELDEAVEKWHTSPEIKEPLYDYLGLTDDEVNAWLKSGSEETLKNMLLEQQKRQRFRIYQLDIANGKTISFAFRGINDMRNAGYEQPPAAEYRLIYDGEYLCNSIISNEEVLQQIFEKYNDNVPADYTGRSVSPSDIVELYDEGKRLYFYCNLSDFVAVKFSPLLAKQMNQ